MDLKEIKDIFKFIKGTDIVEFELEGTNGKVRIKRRTILQPENISHGIVSPAPIAEQKAAEVEKPIEKESVIKFDENLKTITSPIVGTFYRSPSPDTPPFAEAGSVVKKGQVLCIIEAMKLMNEIESEYSGKIVSILVENGHPVEYGEPLFVIEPA